MSDLYVLSRREAIALFGMSAVGIAVASAQSGPASAQARTGEPDNASGSTGPQYIFVTAHWCSANHARQPGPEPKLLPR
jgi:hypothetical protein